MRHLVDYRKLGRTASHREAMLRNMATSLILSERIETTLPKAKELRRLADSLISWGKEGTLHARRQAAAVVRNPEALKKLFDGLASRFKDRLGGYTRIFKYGFRVGDGAEMAAIEYLGYQPRAKLTKAEREKQKAEKAKREKKKEAKKAEARKEKKIEKKAAAEERKTQITAKTEEPREKKWRWRIFGRKTPSQ